MTDNHNKPYTIKNGRIINCKSTKRCSFDCRDCPYQNTNQFKKLYNKVKI